MQERLRSPPNPRKRETTKDRPKDAMQTEINKKSRTWETPQNPTLKNQRKEKVDKTAISNPSKTRT
jgi:hypothetical protein